MNPFRGEQAHLWYGKQTKYRINSKAKDHSHDGLGFEEGADTLERLLEHQLTPRHVILRENEVSLITRSGRLFLGEVELTASDVLEGPRRGLGSGEGLVLPSESFSCL